MLNLYKLFADFHNYQIFDAFETSLMYHAFLYKIKKVNLKKRNDFILCCHLGFHGPNCSKQDFRSKFENDDYY